MSDMATDDTAGQQPRRFKHVHIFKDRHGSERAYFRPPGLRAAPLPTPIGSDEFLEEYNILLEQYDEFRESGRPSAQAENRRRMIHQAIWRGLEPPECGIYFLLRGKTVVYVGSSVSIKARVMQHRQNGRQFDRALAMAAPKEEMVAIEKMLIRAIKPKQNRQGL